jgi:hypothetical protein
VYKAPFPWFGGKSRIAPLVWQAFGQIRCYVEPFAGSLACLLARPEPWDGTETINDKDGLVANFWRALQADPAAVAQHADNPVFENDLHARHSWIVEHKDTLTAKLEGAPAYYDARMAGWWAWGLACWIGGHFASGAGPWRVVEKDGVRQLVNVGSVGQGVNRKLVHLGDAGRGVNRKRVHLGAGRGVNRQRVQLGGAWGDGSGVNRKVVQDAAGGDPGLGECGLLAWMEALAERLRRVRVCCGDWQRICGGRSGDALGWLRVNAGGSPAAIFLDPPYEAADNRDSCYRVEDFAVAVEVREWAIAHGNDPRLRIVLCGYDSFEMPAGWQRVRWKTQGGMGFSSKDETRGKRNRFRECVYLSPHCLPVETSTCKAAADMTDQQTGLWGSADVPV